MKDTSKDKTLILKGGKRHGKRILTCAETVSRMGQNPFENLIRIAAKAEQAGDLATAATNWRYIGDFIDAKRKAIDPGEQAERGKRMATLDELSRIKAAILGGMAEVINPESVIEHQPELVDDLV